MRRLGSIKSRKVSTQSLQSTASTDEHEGVMVATEEEVLSDDIPQEVHSPDQNLEQDDDQDYSKFMPWIKVRHTGSQGQNITVLFAC